MASSRQRRETLLALGFAHLLVQATFLPITLTIPSVATYFSVDVDDAAWSVIIRLLVLGCTVYLAARLGERYGRARMFFLGAVVMSLGNLMAATSQSLGQLIFWSGAGGLGGALITANANALLTMVFDPGERGLAFSVPVTGSRIGTFIGVGLFGLLLHFFNWRLVFFTAFLIGLVAIRFAWPMLKYQYQQAQEGRRAISINYFGAALLLATLAVFTLSGSHLHEGSESFTSPEAVSYHTPMSVLAIALGVLFIVLQLRSKQPYLDLRYFKQKIFSMALFSNDPFFPPPNAALFAKEGCDAFPDRFVLAFLQPEHMNCDPAFAFPHPGPDRRVARLETVYHIEDANPRDFLVHLQVQAVGHVTNHVIDKFGLDAGYPLQVA